MFLSKKKLIENMTRSTAVAENADSMALSVIAIQHADVSFSTNYIFR